MGKVPLCAGHRVSGWPGSDPASPPPSPFLQQGRGRGRGTPSPRVRGRDSVCRGLGPALRPGLCASLTQVPEVARSAADSGLAGESHCHEASGALATPGEPSRQARRGVLAKVRASGQPPAPNTTKAQAPRAGLYPGELGGARQGRERSQELPNIPGPRFCYPPVPLAATDPSHVGGPGGAGGGGAQPQQEEQGS